MPRASARYRFPWSTRTRLLVVAAGGAAILGVLPLAGAQAPAGQSELVVGRNVNMVSGQTLPGGDPYLQRQNEPSVAASTRNPLHLLAGANDYRTVDIPGNFDDGETGDAWMGVFKSFDGGERWESTLLPGYPQDQTPEGLASPLKGYAAAADPVVRPGTNGLLYYSGLVFNRGEGERSAIFVSRFIDNNNKENGDPIAYLSTTLVASSNGGSFLDKPWLAVDVPRAGARVCRIQTRQPAPANVAPSASAPSGQSARGRSVGRGPGRTPPGRGGTIPGRGNNPTTTGPRTVTQEVLAGTMYVAYASITTRTLATGASDVESRIMLSRSEDCGETWSRPEQISRPEDKVNQGATIAIDPTTGQVHVAWRQFGLDANSTDSMMTVSSDLATGTGKGTRKSTKGFGKPRKVHEFKAPKSEKSRRRFRDEILKKMQRGHRMGEVSELAAIKPFDSGTAEDRFRTNAYPTMAVDDESRVYLAWTERGYGGARPDAQTGDARIVLATSRPNGAWTTPRPVDSAGSGTDLPGHQMMPSMAFAGGRLMIVFYDLRQDVSQVFGAFVDEEDAVFTSNRRHTIDLRAVQAPKGDVPVFAPSTLVSQYLIGNLRGSNQVGQLQFNAPNLPLFQLGSVPFMGDYIDLAPAPAFVQNATGQWQFNTASTTAPVFHAVWTDNRDVQKPRDGDWKNYTPPGGATCAPGQAGMRNQNIYSARLTMGLVTGSPGNAKPLASTQPRAFVVFAQNTTYAVKSFRMSIVNQPTGGQASFAQLGATTGTPLLTTVDVTIAPRSMVTRTVYATSSDPKAQVAVDVAEITEPFVSSPISGGLASRVVLNPDISNPDISNPDISNPDISNPDISNAEVYNPDISNPDISNPDISNPDISNPDISNPDISNVRIANPDISNPDISNPDISNPDISNPDISNPDISNPDISNGSLTDVTWTVTNTGNTTAAFNVNLFIANQAAAAGGIKTQLVVHKSYTTPVVDGCTLATQTDTVLVANVLNPTFKSYGDSTEFDPANPDISNTTLWLEPGASGKITLRIVDPDPTDDIGINPVTDVTPVIQADPINTPDLGNPTAAPPATPLPTDPPPPAQTLLAFVAPPSDVIAGAPMAPVTVSATAAGQPQAGVQVVLAIAVNPTGGKLAGVVAVLTDAAGIATFNGLSIDRDGSGYRLSASAAAAGAMPILSAPIDIGVVAPPPNPFVVTNTNDSGLGSLRAAIEAANATPAVDTISFNIPGAGPHVIAVATALPALTQPVVIDGRTQPGTGWRTPMVYIDGAAAVGGGTAIGQAPGFEVHASFVTVHTLGIGRFAGPGVFLLAGEGTRIEESRIGLDLPGVVGAAPNAIGVQVNGGTGHIVANNVISGNVGDGILVVGGDTHQLSSNRIGVSFDEGDAVPNGGSGIVMYGGTADVTIFSNVISGNGTFGAPDPGWGIDIQHSGALAEVTGTVIQGNYIGPSGLAQVLRRGAVDIIGPASQAFENLGPLQRGNAGGGIRLNRASGTLIGGFPGWPNTISGNSGDGIYIIGAQAGAPPRIVGNNIGTGPTGDGIWSNVRRGIAVTGSAAVIGAPGADNRNIISGNLGDGVATNGNAVIENNFIGTDSTGTVALGNARLDDGGPTLTLGCCHAGVFAVAPNNIVRNNLISGQVRGSGIHVAGAGVAAPNLIEGNQVGTDVTGLLPLPNFEGMIIGDQAGTWVRGNRVAFNTLYGIVLGGAVQSALVGGLGVGDGNTIFANGIGVAVGSNPAQTGIGSNRILSNTIYGNAGLGIDIAMNGVTPNDAGDGDAGPNGFQNYPVLSTPINTGAVTTVDYTLDSLEINANHTIQIFANAACDAGGFGEGERLVGSFVQMSDGAGDISVVGAALSELVPVGQFLTATATDAAGNTSEFSQCLEITAPPSPSFSNWTASGDGVLTTPGAPLAGNPIFNYRHNGDQGGPLPPGPYAGAWQYSTISNGQGTVNLDWAWRGMHSFFQASAHLEVFVRRAGMDVSVVNLITEGPVNCCDTPSAGFQYTGTTSVAVQVGDEFGFRITGSHSDGTEVLEGTLTISIEQAPAIMTATPIVYGIPRVAPGFGQMMWLRGINMPATTAADVLFSQGGPEIPATFVWTASPTLTIVRLPAGLALGMANVRLKDAGDTYSTAPLAFEVRSIGGPPVLVQANAGCGAGGAIGSAAVGQAISLLAEGVDTTGATLHWTHATEAPVNQAVPVTSGAFDYVALCVNVPALAPGTWNVSISTTVNGIQSDISAPLVLTITAPPGEPSFRPEALRR
jgi:hypothetical protein